MSEFDKDYSDMGDESGLAIEEQINSVLYPLADYDKHRNALLKELSVVFTRIYESSEPHMVIRISPIDLKISFESVVDHALRESASIDDAMRLIVDLIKADTDERVCRMREMLNNEELIGCFDRDTLEEAINNHLADVDSHEEELDAIVNFYMRDLMSDINSFINHLISQRHSRLNRETVYESNVETKKRPTEHAFDILKVVAGVAIALAVDRLIRRKGVVDGS